MALEPHSDIEVVGEARSGSEVLPRIAETRPDLVMLDVRMPVLDGLEVLDRLRKQYPEIKVVMLSGVDDPELGAESLKRGAKAFIGKAIDPAELAPIMRQIVDGTLLTESFGEAPGTAERASADLGLTGREREILGHVAAGQSNRQIAAELWLSEQTIKYHLTNLYRKLGVSSRTEAARFAYEHGLTGRRQAG
jgi:DNA-binding NarL/FixJ family response regulator